MNLKKAYHSVLRIKEIISFILSLSFFVSFSFSNHIIFIKDKDIRPYNIALSGAREELKKFFPEATIKEFSLRKINGNRAFALKLIRRLKPVLILTAGTKSTNFAFKNLDDFPIVYCMVLYPERNLIFPEKEKSLMTGISIDLSLSVQLNSFKKYLPWIQRLGIVISDENSYIIDRVEKDSKDVGIEIVSFIVKKKADVPKAFKSLRGHVDAIWAFPDSIVYTSRSIEYIILFSIRNKIPLLSFSKNYLRAGAMLCVYSDYKEIGREAGRKAIHIIREKPSEIEPFNHPKKIKIAINRKVFNLLGIAVPKDIDEIIE